MMIETWFKSVARIEALERAARSWVGTPFVANSRVKGPRGGTCCHMLAEQLLIEAGYPLNLSAPFGSMKWSDVQKESLIEHFFDELTDIFQCLELSDPTSDLQTLTSILPGDLIGFRIGGCVHHLGVALLNGRFIHAMRGMGTKIFNLNDPTYARRIEKIWRPKP